MRKLIVEIPDDLHGELKKKAVHLGKTLKNIITDLLYRYLSEPRTSTIFPEETGLCGAWEDLRAPEEIIQDIKKHRKWSRGKTHGNE